MIIASVSFSSETGCSLIASLNPSVKADTYAMAGLGDGYFVEVGVGANLTLVEDKLPITWALQLSPNFFATPPGWGVKFDYDIMIFY